MNALGLAPADVERIFNTHIQDVVLVAYLANTIGTQIDLSNRLASANFGATTPTPAAATTNTTTTSATPAAGGKYSINQYKNVFLYSKKKEVYLPPDCRVIHHLQFTSLLFSSMLKMGALAGGRLVGNDTGVESCIYLVIQGLM